MEKAKNINKTPRQTQNKQRKTEKLYLLTIL